MMRKFDQNVFREGTQYDPERVKDTNLSVADDSRKRPVSMMPMIEDYKNPTKKNYVSETEVGPSKDITANEKG